MQKLYELQLETVVFSVNQYAEDVTNDLVSRISEALSMGNTIAEKSRRLSVIRQESGFINAIIILDSSFRPTIYSGSESIQLQAFIPDSLFRQKTTKLFEYIKSGYRKLEPIKTGSDSMFFLFIVNQSDGSPALCVVALNSKSFVSIFMGPKIRTLTGEQYSIKIIETGGKNELFSHGEARFPPDVIKPVWVLDGYTIGIKVRGETLLDAIHDRTAMNLNLLIAVNLSLFLGAFLIGYILKKEMRLTKLKTDFVANVSHELRTPLSLISMFSESLQLGRVKNDEKRQEYYKIIHSETDRLSGLVNKILNFSQMEAGKKKFVFTEINLVHLVERIYRSYEYHLQQKGFSSELVTGTNEIIISGDVHGLEEIIINLIDNAIKYSDEEKYIRLEVKQSVDRAILELTDKGIGISKEDQTRIFDKFFRAGSSEVHITKGTGLGLAIVKQIIELHKGKMEVKSVLGKGSVFTVSLPVAGEP